MDESGDYHVKQNKPNSESQVSHVFSHKWNLEKEKKKDMKVEGGLLANRKEMSGRGQRAKFG
jgi:hypothetical protein